MSPGMAVAHVRIAFKKQGAEWVAFPIDFNTLEALADSDKYYPATVSWTVVFNGKKVGAIESMNPGPLHGYGDVGTHTITAPTSLIPRITIGAADFSHFGNASKIEATCAGIRSEFQRPGWMEANHINDCRESRGNKEFQDSVPFIGAV